MSCENRPRMSRVRRIVAGMLFFLLTFAVAVPTLAAGNKALGVKVSFSAQKEKESEDDWNKNTYAAEVLPKAGKLAAHQFSSARILIPKSLIRDGGRISVRADLMVLNEKGNEYLGGTTGRYWFYVEEQDGQYVLTSYLDKEKKTEENRYAALKEAGKNLALTITNAPMQDEFKVRKNKKIDKKTTYMIFPSLTIHGSFPKKTSGYVYIDELSVKTAGTRKITFNTKSKAVQPFAYCLYDGKKTKTKYVSVKQK